MDIESVETIKKSLAELDGVLLLSDLKVLLREKEGATFHRAILELIRAKILVRIKRGVYAAPETSLATIAMRISPGSYISTGTALAAHLLIGSVPARKVQAVRVGKPRIFRTPIGTLQFLSVAPSLYFGFERKNDINLATPEKAFVDTFYYLYRGQKFSFDPFSDIDITSLNRVLIDRYLSKYDQRFIEFISRVWR